MPANTLLSSNQPINIRQLGIQDFQATADAMRVYSRNRNVHSEDQIWVLEHRPVFTLGLNGKREHILSPGDIPVFHTDRGGQVTYHGPGQLIIYTLLDLNRFQLSVRQLVTILEQAVIGTLAQYGIASCANPKAPGVYVAGKKIASVGLRITKGRSYHGLSINNHLDLTPFNHINTCGFPNLEVTRLSNLGIHVKSLELAVPIVHAIITAVNQNKLSSNTSL